MPKVTMTKKIREALAKNPKARAATIAKDLQVKPSLVYAVRYLAKKATKQPKKVPKITFIETVSDLVNHPAHYKVGGIETIDFIDAKKLNYNLGNVVKYVTRSGHKGNRIQDLEKALWYLKREIGQV